MVNVSRMQIIETRHFVVVSLDGQVLNVILNIPVIAHWVRFVSAIQSVYAREIDSVLDVICFNFHAVLYHV